MHHSKYLNITCYIVISFDVMINFKNMLKHTQTFDTNIDVEIYFATFAPYP